MSVEVSFVIPCLDEEETIAGAIATARQCVERGALDAEILVADNGSTDASREIAEREGARVVSVPERGYGSAISAGFAAARGRYLVMGDADQSYDFNDALALVEALRAGSDLAMGTRLRGRIEPGAMPFLHRHLGNPALSFVGRLLFRTRVSDFHCGLRAIRREAFEQLDLRTTGMEFASEMVVKAAARGLRISEAPITLHPDRRSRAPHLRTWRDGWRHLRFMMVLSPRWTLFVPGLLLLLLGTLFLGALSMGPVSIGPATLDLHSMQLASLMVMIGYQAVTIAVAARIYAIEEEIGPPAEWMQSAFGVFTLERGILAGLGLVAVGAVLVGVPGLRWLREGFPELDPATTLRPVLLGVTLAALGAHTILMAFVYSMLGIKRRKS